MKKNQEKSSNLFEIEVEKLEQIKLKYIKEINNYSKDSFYGEGLTVDVKTKTF